MDSLSQEYETRI